MEQVVSSIGPSTVRTTNLHISPQTRTRVVHELSIDRRRQQKCAQTMNSTRILYQNSHVELTRASPHKNHTSTPPQNTMTRAMNYRTKRPRVIIRQLPPEQDEYMGQDTRSIDTAMGVRATNGAPFWPPQHEAVQGSFAIPRGLADGRRMECNDDDISVLTEFSGMMEDEEEDASSQTTAPVTTSEAWTVVTTATDSTTIPTRNTGTETSQRRRTKRRHVVVSENLFAHDNTPFKRRKR